MIPGHNANCKSKDFRMPGTSPFPTMAEAKEAYAGAMYTPPVSKIEDRDCANPFTNAKIEMGQYQRRCSL